ncbi:MAG: CarD family transcriptional regulator [Bdellovibrionota bacterium]|jgi:CarD family transcriptional regulator
MRSNKASIRNSYGSRRKSPYSRTPAKPALSRTETQKAYEVGQKVFYRGHGVGQVTAIAQKEIGGVKSLYYSVRMLDNPLMVMVPIDKTFERGMRPIMSADEVKKIYEMLNEKKIVVEQSTWNRRQRDYLDKINTGSVFEIAEVLRDLFVIRSEKVLSFGERRMLELAKSMLIKELAIAEETDEPTVEAQIEEVFAAA